MGDFSLKGLIMKKVIFLILAALFVFTAICAIAIFNSIFPVAPDIEMSELNDIQRITVSINDYTEADVDIDSIYIIYNALENAKPTRRMSINDYPDVRPFYVVTIYDDDDRQYRFMIYNDHSTIYVEIPYCGIYEIESDIIELIENYII
jgi:hypothetical protein